MLRYYTLASPLRVDEAEARLRAVTVPASGVISRLGRSLTWDGVRPPEFVGSVGHGSMAVQYLSPLIGFSSRPFLRGRFEAMGSETRLHIRLRASWADAIVLGLLAAAIGRAISDGGGVVPISVGAFVVIVCACRWYVGSRRALRVVAGAIDGA